MGMSRDDTREELREFKEQWQQEQARFPGGYVPAVMLLNTGPVLRELLEKGHIVCNGQGFKPAGKVERG